MGDISHLKGKIVLVTGGTGTFGRAFVSKLLRDTQAAKIIVFSRDEFKQHEMRQEYPDPDRRLRFFLGDVRDLARLQRAFDGVDVVVHAAALKQIPATEYNPLEAVKTNILGTQNVIDAALDNNVERVLFISSDKAVSPINLYGATKLTAEKLMVAANAYVGDKRKTKFSVARYGNVIGSRGSLVELIQRQRATGTVTLTDERMTRFWITVDKVMGIVVGVLGVMRGGEVFVPKMKSLRVADVIKSIAPECAVRTIGIRPGEKIHEMLITEHETSRTVDLGDVFVVIPEFVDTGREWAQGRTPVPQSFVYVSNHPHFLLPSGDVGQVIEV